MLHEHFDGCETRDEDRMKDVSTSSQGMLISRDGEVFYSIQLHLFMHQQQPSAPCLFDQEQWAKLMDMKNIQIMAESWCIIKLKPTTVNCNCWRNSQIVI